MAFSLTERGVEWIDRAPIRVQNETVVQADASTVFATLADHESWPTWLPGVRRVRVDGRSTGVGATRTVWVGPVAVSEKFVVWEPDTRFSFTLTESGAPGLASMVEDFQLEPLPPAGPVSATSSGSPPPDSGASWIPPSGWELNDW